MLDFNQTEEFLNFLFDPYDVFELRVKQKERRGTDQHWLTLAELGKMRHILPIYDAQRAHVWVGVNPRKQRDSSEPTDSRTLWVDLDSTVKDLETADAAWQEAGLPSPTVVVSSGNGYHLYWRLTERLTPDAIRRYSKGVHDVLPSDNTHDPTRVMRLPGTVNYKREPSPVTIVRNLSNAYSVHEFPEAEERVVVPSERPGPAYKPLNPEDREALLDAYQPGQRHPVRLHLSGYLRKELGHSKEQALAVVKDLAEEAGYPLDETGVETVEKTFNKPLAQVSGASGLYDLGVHLKDRGMPTFTFKGTRPKVSKPAISVIDPRKKITKQRFWMDGFLGPGLVSMWAASSKTGKSFAAMQIAHALTMGYDLWDFPVHGRHRVLYFQGELTEEMVAERWDGMFGAHTRMDVSRIALTDRPDKPIDLSSNPEVLYDLATNYDVIIIDPLMVFNELDENKTHDVREFMGLFDGLRSEGKSVLLVHHTRKLRSLRDGGVSEPQFDDVRGSATWFAAVDAIALQYRTGSEGNTRVKFRYRAAPDRDSLDLYRLSNGGFTHDPNLYLAEMGPFRANFVAN